MKILLSILLTGTLLTNSIYDYSITTIEGATHTLQEYQGKKILLTILPITQTADDSAYLHRIDSLALADSGSLVIIGVPSYEDGYADSLLTTLQPFYRGLLDTSVLITTGMYTHQSSDILQNPLFNWLTHVNGNTHFEEEVEGACQMYFINPQGDLYGVIGPHGRFSNTILNDLMQ